MQTTQTFTESFDRKALLGVETFTTTLSQEDNNYIKVMHTPTDPYSIYDIALRINDKPTLGEIKIRNTVYPNYMLEVKKLKGLLEVKEKLLAERNIDVKIAYINILPNNTTLIWDITNISPNQSSTKLLQKNDYQKNQSQIEKKLIYLNVSDANITLTTKK